MHHRCCRIRIWLQVDLSSYIDISNMPSCYQCLQEHTFTFCLMEWCWSWLTILQNAFELAFFFWLLVSILLTFPMRFEVPDGSWTHLLSSVHSLMIKCSDWEKFSVLMKIYLIARTTMTHVSVIQYAFSTPMSQRLIWSDLPLLYPFCSTHLDSILAWWGRHGWF
jgi:hypothetical protein